MFLLPFSQHVNENWFIRNITPVLFGLWTLFLLFMTFELIKSLPFKLNIFCQNIKNNYNRKKLEDFKKRYNR